MRRKRGCCGVDNGDDAATRRIESSDAWASSAGSERSRGHGSRLVRGQLHASKGSRLQAPVSRQRVREGDAATDLMQQVFLIGRRV